MEIKPDVVLAAAALVLMCSLPLLAWFAKEWANSAKELATEAKLKARIANEALQDHRLHVAENYVCLKRFEGFESAIFERLDKIAARMDEKADR